MAAHTLAPGTYYLAVFRIVGTAAFLSFGLGPLANVIWKGYPWSFVLKEAIDGLIYALLMLSAFTADAKFAIRQLRRSPGFAIAAIITLALGIGATTAIFSLVDGILLRPLPFPHTDRLLAIETLEFPPGVAPTNLGAANYESTSYPDFFDWQRQNQTFASLASYNVNYRLFAKKDGSHDHS